MATHDINERLRAAMEDERWAEWMKEAQERAEKENKRLRTLMMVSREQMQEPYRVQLADGISMTFDAT